MPQAPHLLLVVAPYYAHLSALLREGAERDIGDIVGGGDRHRLYAAGAGGAAEPAHPADIGDDPAEHGLKLGGPPPNGQRVSRMTPPRRGTIRRRLALATENAPVFN